MNYIKSILDNDLYALTMQQAILEHYPNTQVSYKFTNRNLSMKFNEAAINAIRENIKALADLKLTDSEYEYLKTLKFLGSTYIEYLRNFRFNPAQVRIHTYDGNLHLSIHGPWEETIFFEVPVLAIISEAYFEFVDTAWKTEDWEKDQIFKAEHKANHLSLLNKNLFSEFGTRRRRSYDVQDLVVDTFCKMQKDGKLPNFHGTSNVHLAHVYGIKAIGTFAHQWVMGVSALESLRFANRFALQKWNETYKGMLGYALTDTYGTDAFFSDFNHDLARVYDGLRHDSGCPLEFTDKAISHYLKLGIDPTTKTLIFSDGLDVGKALEISVYCRNKIQCSFGIGTFFTSDFENSKALNIVIKLNDVNGIPVVKLSDSPGKATGDEDALKVAKWTFFGTKL
jgi:nicotinate phosphoribosyltransferase